MGYGLDFDLAKRIRGRLGAKSLTLPMKIPKHGQENGLRVGFRLLFWAAGERPGSKTAKRGDFF